MKKLIAFLMVLALPIATAFAIDLESAKKQGLVGEQPNGYLGAVTAPSAETKKLIDDINAKRKQKYQEIAAGNKTSLQAVEQLAGQKAIEKTEPGGYVQQGGAWKKK